MIPVDGRKYKEETIKTIIDQHTFKPKINDKCTQIVNKRYAKLMQQWQ